MRIGRNEPCTCGSGKKYKKCCLNADRGERPRTLRAYSFRIDADSFPPRIEGADEQPDIKQWLKKALMKAYFGENADPQHVIESAMQEYNLCIEYVNASLPRPYGIMLREMHGLLDTKEYEQAAALAEHLLGVFPESAEAAIGRDEALFALERHPLQELAVRLSTTTGKEKQKIFWQFTEQWRNASNRGKELLFHLMEQQYYQSSSWEGRYAAIGVIKSMFFMDIDDFDDGFLERFDRLLLAALCDDKGAIRKNAVYAVGSRRGFHTPFPLFFQMDDAARKEHDTQKQRTLCRAILECVSPVTDEMMDSIGAKKDYRRAIEFALKITGYDPTYYRASPREKMMMRLTNPKIIVKKYAP